MADGLGDCIHSLRLSTGAPLSSVGGLSYPHGLAVAGGTLYVADWGNHRIMTFDRDTLQPLGPIGRGPGEGETVADLTGGKERPMRRKVPRKESRVGKQWTDDYNSREVTRVV